MRPWIWLATVVSVGIGHGLAADRIPAAETDAIQQAPIRALLITGGCCHDYARQKLILTKGISARADVVWTVVQQGGTSTDTKIPVYEDADWADGFDIVVHNECFSNVRDVAWVERILKPHREGLPAVLIHCAMHCYRTGDDRWFEFAGVQSPGHGPHYAYTVENRSPEHPIMTGFGDQWTTTKGELYHALKVFPTATPLAHANRKSDGQPQVCVWTNEYGRGRVFATTIGHYNETMADPKYLDMLARGLLWAVGRDPQTHFRPTDQTTNDQIRALTTASVTGAKQEPAATVCCGSGNLAFGKPTKADSEETGKNNFARNAVDGNLKTRWCAANGRQSGPWWQVDLQEPTHVKSVRIHWEMSNAAYRYKVDASADGQAWTTIVDQSDNDRVLRVTPHAVDSPNTRFLRVNFLGSSTGSWSSFWEFEAYAGELPELPESVTAAVDGSQASLADARIVDNGSTADAQNPKSPVAFDVTMFAQPPEVNYPVCLTAAPTGEVFIGVDEQGSLGKEKGRGKVLRCLDIDGDGVADRINEFARMDHPRGLIYDKGSLWVLHPPTLSVYHDDDLDGVADRQETLITGISTDEVERRGADHTTNGIRMGIDGWIYIAVGDFGFVNAKGADGTTISRRGGGIVRVRPDGTEMEVFAWGLRNILDVCIDPYMNVFTRDNTNDGGGWDIRLSHILQSGEYGYPSLYKNFADEIMPPLADYGGGSGCGGMYLHDTRWPAPFGNALYTCDWGRNEVYRHSLPAAGPTFAPHQQTFMKIPRPTDIDVDGSGRMYISSWKNGQFSYKGPDVGFVVQVRPTDFLPKPFPDLNAADDAALVDLLAAPSAVHRLHGQREILRRQATGQIRERLVALATDGSAPLPGRVAAVFTLAQCTDASVKTSLLEFAKDDHLREFALRALTDRREGLDALPLQPFIDALSDDNPRVRAQALISLGRIGNPAAADAVLPLTDRDETAPIAHNQPAPQRIIPHLAVRALVAMKAVDACLKGLDGEHSAGAIWALRYMHDEAAVDGLIHRLSTTRQRESRSAILSTLVRLYHREGQYTGGWWGTRPDTSGPYYDRKTWAASEKIARLARVVVGENDPATVEFLLGELARHKVMLPGLPKSASEKLAGDEPDVAVTLPAADPNNPNQIANLDFEAASQRALQSTGDAERGKALFKSQACIACHTYANGQLPKGPHLVDIGKRYKRSELIESILKPSAKIAQGFDTHAFIMADGKVLTGFVVGESAEDVQIRQNDGISKVLLKPEIEERVKQKQSMMPVGLVNNLTPEQLADLLAYLESLH